MRSSSIFFCAASLLSTALAQGTSVPSQLSSGFTPNEITLSVGYNGDGTQSFADGSTLQTSQVAKQPLFALGDSSGINTQTNFVVAMVDSTDPNNLVLHFMQTGFEADGDETDIASEVSPVVSYQQPGAFNEQGKRQYSFLLYSQSGSSVKTGSLPQGVPSTGQTFDVSSFQQANGLQQPIAGLAMFVDLGGSSASTSSSSSAGSTASAAGQTGASVATTTSAAVAPGGSSSSQFSITFQSPVVQSTQSIESSASTSGASSTSTSTSIVEASASSSSGSSATGGAAAASSSAGTASGSTTIYASRFSVASGLTALVAVFGGALLLWGEVENGVSYHVLE